MQPSGPDWAVAPEVAAHPGVNGETLRVGINSAIRSRAISGTSRGVDHIEEALVAEPGIQILPVYPPRGRAASKIRQAARDSYWDLWKAARTSPRADVFISPCNIGWAPTSLPHLLMVHDTVVLDHPEWHDRSYAAYARMLFGFSAKFCTRIVTVSNYSAMRIRERWPDAPPIAVLPWPSSKCVEGPREMPSSPLTVLMVAASVPHKNHAAAIEAVRLSRLTSGEDIRLVLVGPKSWNEDSLIEAAHAADPQQRWLQRRTEVSDEELAELYDHAWLLVHPALDEGFGLPLLEAAARATPVIHSGRGGMSEVVPLSVDSVCGENFSEEILRHLDSEYFARASRTALEAARVHSPSRFRSKLVGLLREVHGRSASPAR